MYLNKISRCAAFVPERIRFKSCFEGIEDESLNSKNTRFARKESAWEAEDSSLVVVFERKI